MNIKISFKQLRQIVSGRTQMIIYLIILVVIGWLIYFTYQNLYTSVISPKEIDKSEIIAKRQKVNLELFNEINQKINNKKEASNETLQNIKNPFD